MNRTALRYTLRSPIGWLLTAVAAGYVTLATLANSPVSTTIVYAILFGLTPVMVFVFRYRDSVDRQASARDRAAEHAQRAAERLEQDLADERRALDDDIVAASRAAREASGYTVEHTAEAQAILDSREAEWQDTLAARRADRRARLAAAGMLDTLKRTDEDVAASIEHKLDAALDALH